jgi:hypothetical protein
MNQLQVGVLNLDKGHIRKDVRLFAWDTIQDCNPEFCPASHLCTYLKQGKCAVLVQYIKVLYKSILSNYSNLDDVSLFKIGMQIIPLYLTLGKLQLFEMGLRSPLQMNDKGLSVSHPIYREIRETMKTISAMWKDLELSFETLRKPSPTAGDDLNGDPSYYESMISNNAPQKGVIR